MILLKGGFSKPMALLSNFIIANFMLPGVFIASLFKWKPYLLMATAGNFICLAFFQLLPEIRESLLNAPRYKARGSLLMLSAILWGSVGVGIIYAVGLFPHTH